MRNLGRRFAIGLVVEYIFCGLLAETYSIVSLTVPRIDLLHVGKIEIFDGSGEGREERGVIDGNNGLGKGGLEEVVFDKRGTIVGTKLFEIGVEDAKKLAGSFLEIWVSGGEIVADVDEMLVVVMRRTDEVGMFDDCKKRKT